MYVADLAAYNEGNLIGEWLELDGKDSDALQLEIAALLAKWSTPVAVREEWAAHDWDGPKGLASMGEYPNLQHVVQFVECYQEHGEAWALYVDNQGGGGGGYDCRDFEERYQGCHESLEGYAQDYLDGTGALESMPENLRMYFDCKAFGRDLELGGDIWTARGEEGLHVYDNH